MYAVVTFLYIRPCEVYMVERSDLVRFDHYLTFTRVKSYNRRLPIPMLCVGGVGEGVQDHLKVALTQQVW